jgi:hypothetical protein
MYVLVKDGVVAAYPHGPAELRRAHPGTSFPAEMSAQELATWDVFTVAPRNPPAHDSATENCERVPPTLVDAEWIETWAVTQATAEQITQRRQEQAAFIRAARNAKLAASDWTQLADSTADKTAWATYRQALRDVTEQSGFPWTIDWPVAP